MSDARFKKMLAEDVKGKIKEPYVYLVLLH